MSGEGLFGRLNLLADYEEMLINIVIEALQLLQDNDSSENETSLNRKLYQCIIRTYSLRSARGEDIPESAPAFDAPNPPMTAAPIASEKTRPDLRWDLVDHLQDPASVRSYAVECKRLRTPSHGRIFTSEYALNGVARFVKDDHQYGENMASGVMVGYWQEMSREALLAEINDALADLDLPELIFDDAAARLLHQASQQLARGFTISPYTLRHLWLDMRSDAAVVAAEVSAIATHGDSSSAGRVAGRLPQPGQAARTQD